MPIAQWVSLFIMDFNKSSAGGYNILEERRRGIGYLCNHNLSCNFYYAFVFSGALITGRRHMGEIPIFDFLVIITLGSVVGADISEPDIAHWPIIYAMLLIMLMQYLYGVLIIKNRTIGKLLTFEPVVVIENGQFVKSSLRKLKYSMDTVLTMLREKDVFDVSEVEFAIIESTGQLSVLKKSQYQPLTAKELKINTDYKGLSIPLIVEGEIYEQNLQNLHLSKQWLMEQLHKSNLYHEKNVFYAAINTEGKLYISRGMDSIKDIHNIRH
ncbi:DUF421 domain-containing protein [Desulforamulus ruminis]